MRFHVSGRFYKVVQDYSVCSVIIIEVAHRCKKGFTVITRISEQIKPIILLFIKKLWCNYSALWGILSTFCSE